MTLVEPKITKSVYVLHTAICILWQTPRQYIERNFFFSLTKTLRMFQKPVVLPTGFHVFRQRVLGNTALVSKCQLILKATYQAVNSYKKRTNEFIFTIMGCVFVHFSEEIEDTKKNLFEITWPLTSITWRIYYLTWNHELSNWQTGNFIKLWATI